MKKLFIIAFSLFMTIGMQEVAAQSLLKKLGDAVQKEVKKEANKAVDRAIDRAVDKAIDGITNPKPRPQQEPKEPKQEKVKKQKTKEEQTDELPVEIQVTPQPQHQTQPQGPQRNSDLIRRPEPEQPQQQQGVMPPAAPKPNKWAPHTKQGQAQAEAEKYKYVQDVDLYFEDGGLKGTNKLYYDGNGYFVEIREKYYALKNCNEEIGGVKYNYSITYLDLPLYISDNLAQAGVVIHEQKVEELKVQKANQPKYGTVNGHDWIDLGLPSGTKWATCNVGASLPEQPGKLYAWGETNTKSSYSTSNYLYQGKTATDIAGWENLDVATKLWGKEWRMPTKEQFQELLDYTEGVYTKHEGRLGMLMTSTINKQSIFLPACGHIDGTEHSNPNTCGNYWTSTPEKNSSSNVHMWVYGAIEHYIGGAAGHCGGSVRAVTK